MQTTLLIIISLALVGTLGFLFVLYKKLQESQKPKEGDGNLFIMLQQQLHVLQQHVQDQTKAIDQKMADSSKAMSETTQHLHQTIQSQHGQNTRIFADVTEKLTKLEETNKQVVGVADQLQGLENILKNPKQRGILGEYYLETLLKNVMAPGSYAMQYQLGKDENGSDLIPDAVIFVKDKIIPIDSKFSLENYNKLVEATDPLEKERLEKLFVNDLKNRIVETAKYIQPSKGTMEFAIMFIPHEAIYYDLLVNKVGALKTEDTENLLLRAAAKYKVMIVSPTNLMAYLQTIMQGLRGMQIEESAKEIRAQVEKLWKHLLTYEDYMKKMGGTLGTTVGHYNNAYKEFAKIDKDVVKIAGGEAKTELLQIEKPTLDL